MKTTINKKLMGLALSAISMASMAQCPSITNLSIAYGANGSATITPVISGSVNPSQATYYWQVSPYATQSFNTVNSVGEFQFPANGNYNLCLSISDSLSGCGISQYCDTVNISNIAATSCNASYTYYRDSNCVTHFINTSTGTNLSYNWNIDGTSYTSTDPVVSLSSGYHTVFLSTYTNGQLCDSIGYTNNYLVNSCTTYSTACQASFYTYTDSLCMTHFINTSTFGGAPSSQWYINGQFYNTSDVVLSLANGNYPAYLFNYSNGAQCDSSFQNVYINCANGGTTTPTGCQVNSSFYIFSDSLNTGNYFAYNLSSGTGSLSYLWNFGDGTSSSQQYPFHQYAVPGQYIICLTVTGTDSSATCSDTYCDSSSVHRIAAGFQMSQINVKPMSVTGIKQVENVIGLKAFPNPIADELTIEATTSNDQKLNYILVDALGRAILTGNLNDAKVTINTSNLEKGFYSLSVTNEKGNSLKTIKLAK